MSEVIDFSDRVRRVYESKEVLQRRGGGGDNGGMDDLTRRVGTLETKMDKVQETLVSIQLTLARMEEKAATKEELSNVRVEVAEMKGRVAKLPSLPQIAALLAIAGAIFKGLSFIHS